MGRVLGNFAYVLLLGPLLIPSVHAQHSPDGGGGLAPQESSNAFFRIFDDPALSSARAECMGGEKFTQTYSGKSHTRSVSKMSNGYFYGMMMSFAKNVCSDEEGALNKKLQGLPGTTGSEDTLNHYGSMVSGLSEDVVVQNYALLLPLGMIESSGMYNEGRDKSASNVSATTTEAGLFQVSHNSTNLGGGSMGQVYQELLSKYEISSEADLTDNPHCMTGIYGLNQRLSKNTESYGGGAGLMFQNVMKKCPALATDYMAALLRTNKRHNGPLNRKEARPRQACVNVMEKLKEHLSTGENCGSLDKMIADFPADSRAREVFPVNAPVDNSGVVSSPASGGSIYDSASEYRDQAAALEDEQKALAKAGYTEAAKNLQEQIDALKTDAGNIEKNPKLIRSKIDDIKKTIEGEKGLLKQIEQSKINEKVYREEAKELKAAAQEKLAKAAATKDPEQKKNLEAEAKELEGQAAAKEKLANEYAADWKKLEAEVAELKKLSQELEKKEKEAIEKTKTRIKEIQDKLRAMDIQEADIKREMETNKDPKLKEQLETLQKERAKLKEELGNLETLIK